MMTATQGALAARAGGVLAVGASVALLISEGSGPAEVEFFDAATAVFASAAAVLAIVRPRSLPAIGWATALLFFALLTAVFRWTPLLYMPSLVLFVLAMLALPRGERHRRP